MSISITFYQATFPKKIPLPEKIFSEKSDSVSSENTPSGADKTVSISNSARALFILSNADKRQASMSKSNLRVLYANGMNHINNFGDPMAGGKYNKEDLLPKTDDPNRLAVGQQSLDYTIGLFQIPTKHLPNPFEGMARNNLSAIIYDDSDTFTDAERTAAYGELSRQDEAYFSKLYANLTNEGDTPQVVKGMLDYFDALPPVEKTVYPDGFRDIINNLYQDQLQQWGLIDLIKLADDGKDKKLSESISNEGQSSGKTLQSVLERAIKFSNVKV